ncbi:MAG: BatA domain-containing protein, partial [Ignavibacteria bacterium]|nr:BatA domain-containing protein [Ignavibacteria bacterium]
MNFFNPYILFGLIAVAVPILLHILNLQKVQKMEFSTLMFLKELQKSRFRRIRVKQWPLMLTRILIVAFLVLTFADFFIEGYSAGGKDVTKLGMIFTDSSYSMNLTDGQDSLMKTAGILQDEITGLFSSSDEIRIFNPKVADGFDTTFVSHPVKPYLSGILLKSAEESEKFNYPVKEVFVITDFQKINFNYTRSKSGDKTFYYFINTSPYNYSNISVNKLEAVTKIPEPSRQLTFRAVVKNHGENVITDVSLIFSAEGIKQEEKTLTLNPYE